MEGKNIKQQYLDFDEYIKEQLKLGEIGPNEVEEMKEIFHEVIQEGGIGENTLPTNELMFILTQKEQKWGDPYSMYKAIS